MQKLFIDRGEATDLRYLSVTAAAREAHSDTMPDRYSAPPHRGDSHPAGRNVIVIFMVLAAIPQPAQKPAVLDALTLRQRQVMDLVLAGHTSKTIAVDLGISRRTVREPSGGNQTARMRGLASSTDAAGAWRRTVNALADPERFERPALRFVV